MRPFEFSQQTKVIFDSPITERVCHAISIFGRKVLIVTGSTAAHSLGILSDLTGFLGVEGIEFETFEGIPSNPGAAIVDAGSSLAMGEKCDVIVGIGGGSVLDVAKAIGVGAVRQKPYRELLSGIRKDGTRITGSLPVLAIPTLIGSGSETNGTSVIVDEASGRKLSFHSDLAAPRIAYLDPTYAAVAPRPLLGAGIADALAHAIEAGLSNRANLASDSLAHAAISLILENGEGASWGDVDAVASCLWASNLAGQALSIAGSIITHPLAHPLSARLGAHHGESVAALEPAVLEAFQRSWTDEGLKVGRWFGSKTLTPSAAIHDIRATYVELCGVMGVTRTAFDLGMRGEYVERFVEDVLNSGSRGLANTLDGSLRESQLRDIYLRALNT